MTRAPCCEKDEVKKGPWTPEEDELLIKCIKEHGEGNWSAVPKRAGLIRCGKSCRLRWANYLRPDLKRGTFSLEEEDLIIKLHEEMGNRWSKIALELPGRTDNDIKNHWNTRIKKRLREAGICPETHKPLPPPQAPAATVKKYGAAPSRKRPAAPFPLSPSKKPIYSQTVMSDGSPIELLQVPSEQELLRRFGHAVQTYLTQAAAGTPPMDFHHMSPYAADGSIQHAPSQQPPLSSAQLPGPAMPDTSALPPQAAAAATAAAAALYRTLISASNAYPEPNTPPQETVDASPSKVPSLYPSPQHNHDAYQHHEPPQLPSRALPAQAQDEALVLPGSHMAEEASIFPQSPARQEVAPTKEESVGETRELVKTDSTLSNGSTSFGASPTSVFQFPVAAPQELHDTPTLRPLPSPTGPCRKLDLGAISPGAGAPPLSPSMFLVPQEPSPRGGLHAPPPLEMPAPQGGPEAAGKSTAHTALASEGQPGHKHIPSPFTLPKNCWSGDEGGDLWSSEEDMDIHALTLPASPSGLGADMSCFSGFGDLAAFDSCPPPHEPQVHGFPSSEDKVPRPEAVVV